MEKSKENYLLQHGEVMLFSYPLKSVNKAVVKKEENFLHEFLTLYQFSFGIGILT